MSICVTRFKCESACCFKAALTMERDALKRRDVPVLQQAVAAIVVVFTQVERVVSCSSSSVENLPVHTSGGYASSDRPGKNSAGRFWALASALGMTLGSENKAQSSGFSLP